MPCSESRVPGPVRPVAGGVHNEVRDNVVRVRRGENAYAVASARDSTGESREEANIRSSPLISLARCLLLSTRVPRRLYNVSIDR